MKKEDYSWNTIGTFLVYNFSILFGCNVGGLLGFNAGLTALSGLERLAESDHENGFPDLRINKYVRVGEVFAGVSHAATSLTLGYNTIDALANGRNAEAMVSFALGGLSGLMAREFYDRAKESYGDRVSLIERGTVYDCSKIWNDLKGIFSKK